MAIETEIAWTDSTFNGMIGCSKVSPGCAHCYAEQSTPSKVFDVQWGDGKLRRRTSDAYWEQPYRWNKMPRLPNTLLGDIFDGRPTRRRRVFCGSLCDWLDDGDVLMPNGQVDKRGRQTLRSLLTMALTCANLDWLFLTKRIHLWRDRMVEILEHEEESQHVTAHCIARNWIKGVVAPNFWMGTSAENQEWLEERVPYLLRVPAKVRFLSCEPLLEELDLSPAFGENLGCGDAPANPDCVECGHLARKVDWVIVGGESGKNARECRIEWIESIVEQCAEHRVPCFVKQLGSNSVGPTGLQYKTKHPKGGDPAEWPEPLVVRDFPAYEPVHSGQSDGNLNPTK